MALELERGVIDPEAAPEHVLQLVASCLRFMKAQVTFQDNVGRERRDVRGKTPQV